ncbi:MAG: S-layer homology domain-containing protein [Clostridiales bacterium]|nr:S-layer homology domain-containing protein [Clostridiales bacterium]
MEKVANGSVKVSPTRASSGRTVTITVTPDEGYKLDKLTVTDKSGDEIELTKVSDTRYTFTMPRGAVEITAAFAEEEVVSTLPFTDVDLDDWFYDAVEYAYDNGMMNGTGNSLFAPTSSLNRAMMAQVLWNLEGSPAASSTTAYSDVASDVWYYDAVQWATAKGIVGGYGDGIYGPEDNITREQMALMLYRYAQYKGYDATQGGMEVREFTDYEEISDWALEGMTWAVNAGLLSGKGSGVLDPAGNATRAEVAQILMNFCENIVK